MDDLLVTIARIESKLDQVIWLDQRFSRLNFVTKCIQIGVFILALFSMLAHLHDHNFFPQLLKLAQENNVTCAIPIADDEN